MAKGTPKGKQEVIPDGSNDAEVAMVEVASAFLLELEKEYKLSSEVAIAVNWKTDQSKFLIEIDGRDYPDYGPDWMYGTADLIGHKVEQVNGQLVDHLYVADWKTGGTDGAEEQLLSLLAATWKAYQSHGAKHFGTMTIDCIQVISDDRGARILRHPRVVSIEELEMHWLAMKWQAEEMSKDKYKPVPGIHCTTLYCPHLAYCEAIGDALDSYAEGPEGLLAPEYLVRKNRINGAPADDKEAAHIMERISAAKRQLNYLTESMKEYVRNGGQIISGKFQWSGGPDGFRWRKVSK